MKQWEKTAAVLAGSLGIATGLLASLEGYSPKPYLDVAGILTDCYGNTHGVSRNKIRTKEECTQLLHNESARIGQMLLKDQPNHSIQSLASGISFVYNIGDGAYRSSTYRKKLLAQDWVGACNEMYRWVYITRGGTKVKSKGLENRREKEVKLCLTGEY